jgi:phosphoglycolate phosphatase-like HAD superfamily hydrolase
LNDKRLYLFDIDGTLINTGGAGGQAMRAAFAALWNRADGFAGIEFSGRTDRALIKEALVATGLDNGAFEEDLRRFKRSYFRRLTKTLPANPGSVLPGVVAFLERLRAEADVTVALGTGNFRAGATMKLSHYGLDHYFGGLGGFGDNVEDRALMIEEAIRRAKRRAGVHPTVFVIGDTVHDMTAAKANKVIAVGVTTGPASEQILSKAGADIVLSTLESAADHLL